MATQLRYEALDPVRADLCGQVERLGREHRSIPLNELCNRVHLIRSSAKRHGLEPARHVAGAFSDALARDGRATMVNHYLEVLREALECDPLDKHGGHTLLASLSVRYAG